MPEEAAIYVLSIVLGAPSVVLTAARGERFGGGATLCLIMLLFGVVGLGRMLARRVVVPRARAQLAPPRDSP